MFLHTQMIMIRVMIRTNHNFNEESNALYSIVIIYNSDNTNFFVHAKKAEGMGKYSGRGCT